MLFGVEPVEDKEEVMKQRSEDEKKNYTEDAESAEGTEKKRQDGHGEEKTSAWISLVEKERNGFRPCSSVRGESSGP